MDSTQLSGQVQYENDIQAIRTSLAFNLSVFKEPRGVMRIFHFIFSICAFATTTGFTNFVIIESTEYRAEFEIEYPYRLNHLVKEVNVGNNTEKIQLYGNFSSDAEFFVATGVIAMLYTIAVIVLYVLFDAMYQSKEIIPITDFALTTIVAVLWLSGSAAWANGLTGLKTVTDPETLGEHYPKAAVHTGSYSKLSISVLLGFLNFFLWTSDLWFLYKETTWFKLRQSVNEPVTTA
ncbi:synaptoporin-like isoform X2 [Ischnura elegans]|uniref:synaptoporin-like isoform X2 n=1 Tax=Ischnura elegans TaxID=197161 RepID=UPI001ED8A0D0|nr:synaptoporin-like isoform X2 [Ischnura elegans]